MTREGTNKLMNKFKWIQICTYISQDMLVWWQEVVGCRDLAQCWCAVEQGTPADPRKRLDFNPRTPFAIKMHLRHGPMFFLSVCMALVKVPLYSDSSRELCWTIYRVFQTDRFVCMLNTHSHHLGSSWVSEQNRKVQTRSTKRRWTNRAI